MSSRLGVLGSSRRPLKCPSNSRPIVSSLKALPWYTYHERGQLRTAVPSKNPRPWEGMFSALRYLEEGSFLFGAPNTQAVWWKQIPLIVDISRSTTFPFLSFRHRFETVLLPSFIVMRGGIGFFWELLRSRNVVMILDNPNLNDSRLDKGAENG